MGRAKGVKETVNPDKRMIAIRNLEIARQKRRDQVDELKQLKEEKQQREEKEAIKSKPKQTYQSDNEYDEEDVLYLPNEPTGYDIYMEEQKILKAERQAKQKQRHKKLKNEISELKKLTTELKESLTSKPQPPNKNDPFEERLTTNILKF